MIDFLAAITVALAMVGIIGMVLVPTSLPHSRLRRIDQRASLAQWFAKYF
jgi:type II secretory pathway pseudopilin PulG